MQHLAVLREKNHSWNSSLFCLTKDKVHSTQLHRQRDCITIHYLPSEIMPHQCIIVNSHSSHNEESVIPRRVSGSPQHTGRLREHISIYLCHFGKMCPFSCHAKGFHT